MAGSCKNWDTDIVEYSCFYSIVCMDNIVPLQVRTQHFLTVKYKVPNAPQKVLKPQDQGIEESQMREKSARLPFSLPQSKAIESCPKS